MTDRKVNLYQDLIDDYTKSINNLKINLNKVKDLDEARKLTFQIEGYKEQLLKLKEAIK